MKRDLGYFKLLGVVALVGLVIGMAGCGQNTKATLDQPAEQTQQPESNNAAQAGNYTANLWVINTTDGVPKDGGVTINTGVEAEALQSDNGGNSLGKGKAGNQIAGLTFNLTMGGSSTGSQSAAATGTQSNQPGATSTQTPSRKDEASVQVPIGIAMPGGFAAPNAAGATGQSQTSLTPSQSAELTTLLNKANAQQASAAELERMAQLLQLLKPADKPQPGN